LAAAPQTDLLDRVRELLCDGEVLLALEQLRAFVPGLGSAELTREVVLHAGSYAALRKRSRQGRLTAEQTIVAEAELRNSLLEFVDEIGRQIQRRQLRFAVEPVFFVPPEDARLEKVFGVSHLKRIAWLQQGLNAAASVCRIVAPNCLGTGFLVGGNRLLTNHHVIPSADVAAKSQAEFNYEEEVDGTIKRTHGYRLKAATVRAAKELDYCMVEVEEKPGGPPLASWRQVAFEEAQMPNPGEHVTIIQHPEGGPKQIAVTANQVVNVFGARLQYTTDTLPGSSGSPVFNDQWRVIAVHHAGGNLVKNDRGDRMFANEGILIRDILRDIA
jgi:V8-like Glu-specific endopeptidase